MQALWRFELICIENRWPTLFLLRKVWLDTALFQGFITPANNANYYKMRAHALTQAYLYRPRLYLYHAMEPMEPQ